jgi:hypothetical protein
MATPLSARRRLLDRATRARAGRAKALVLLGAAATFAAAFGLSRASHPSHPKRPAKALHPPAEFVRQVQQDERLHGGLLGPAQASPEAQTAAS